MTKQRREGVRDQGPEVRGQGSGGGGLKESRAAADDLLLAIRGTSAEIERIEDEYNVAVTAVTERYAGRLAPLKSRLQADGGSLLTLMKKQRGILFYGTDVVYLTHGSLIHSLVDKVKIPRNRDAVIALCEELGFKDVVKIAKSLDREAVEKWPDEKLFLIGAERKTKEEFSYDLKKDPIV